MKKNPLAIGDPRIPDDLYRWWIADTGDLWYGDKTIHPPIYPDMGLFQILDMEARVWHTTRERWPKLVKMRLNRFLKDCGMRNIDWRTL